jgi:iron complex outermembrane recepter protein
VLRGPQGTLYGRNTTGGAVNLVTKRPSSSGFTMAHQITYGARNQLQGKSSVNVPINDALAVKLAVLGDQQDGFVRNDGPGTDFSDKRQTGVRFDARWLAADWLTADYSYDQTDLRYGPGLFQAILPPNTNHGLGEYFKNYAMTQTVYSGRRLDSLETSVPLHWSASHIKGHALALQAAVLEGLELKYVGAYREITDDEYQDLGGGAGSQTYRLDTGAWDGPSADMVNGCAPGAGCPTPSFIPHVFQRQTSHELQLSGTAFETLEFVAGVFKFDESGGENGHPVHHILNSYVDPSQMPPEFGATFAAFTNPMLVGYWDYDFSIRNGAKALFTQVTWSPDYLNRRLHATAGVRKSWDERHAVKTFAQIIYAEGKAVGTGQAGAMQVPDQVANMGSDPFNNVHGDRSYTDLSPSANVRYDLTKDLNVYLSSSRAYKSGGFNVRDPQMNADSGVAADSVDYGFGFAEGFRPEYVRSTELGMKSEWFGRRLRLNADVFDSHLTDMQTNFLIGGSISDTKARNVGKARMRGLEFETTFVALPGLLLSLDGAYLDAKVIECLDVDGKNVADLYPFPSAPPVSGVASVDWTFFERNGYALRTYVDYHYLGKRQGVVIVEERRDLTAMDPYSLINARVIASGLHLGGGALEFALWGRNLADKEYVVYAIDNTPQADRSVLWGDPRTIGLDTMYRFY